MNTALCARCFQSNNETTNKKEHDEAYLKIRKINGDMRGRFEQNNAENSAYSERNRARYRLRVGATATMLEDFETGFRLASGDPFTGGAAGTTLFGGNPVSANTTLGSGNSRKFIWVDTAYGKWTPIHNDVWTVSGTLGKFDNPFQISNMVFDYDIQPEGAALQLAYKPADAHTLKFNGGFFLLNEINQGVGASHDPFVMGGQLLLESKWTPKIETTLGISLFNIVNKDQLLPSQAPNADVGNTRNAAGVLQNNYNPVVGSASLTYKLDEFPLYKGEFPIKFGGEFMKNPGASSNNEGWNAGITLGKANHKGTWELIYRYQVLRADAWYEEFPDDDNGAFYATGHPLLTGASNANGLQGAGFFGGTNIKGHYIKATYAITDFATFAVSYYMNDLIINNSTTAVADQRDRAGHLIADIMWKF
ncbi:MAG: putative porin [Verrucomicrobia bacterium]|nr:putative porin [Verrucomicrobiota bacterium]